MALTSFAAGLFLLAAVPIAFFVSYSDLARMKIPNIAVGALFGAYVLLGLFALPFDAYLWGYVHLVVALIAGIVLNAAGVMGAGDAKFIAAASPMIALPDLPVIMIILCASLLGGFAAHRIARASPLRTAVPHWESWTSGKRFPMGLPLAMTLVIYLGIAVYH